jgi:hypothetical protein
MSKELIIKIPGSFLQEREYISKVIFGEFLGIDFLVEINSENIAEYQLTFLQKKIILKDHFFANIPESKTYLNKRYIPKYVCKASNQFMVEEEIPVIYGDGHIEVTENSIDCGIDIFASCFFMLSRWEEKVIDSRDDHCRFSRDSSLAYKHDFLMRPIVNEYIEMLWNMLLHLGFQGKRRRNKFHVLTTHDVDEPYQYYFKNPWGAIRTAGSFLLRDKALLKSLKVPFNYSKSKFNPDKYDKFNTFDIIMRLNEKKNRTCIFFFIAKLSNERINGDYDIQHPRMLRLLNEIDARGHDIGLHGSYYSYNDPDILSREWHNLLRACEKAGVKRLPVSNRQHYLRWETSKTARILSELGLRYDYTLAFSDNIGFRAGTCFEFSLFDIETREQLAIKERPLVLMECSLFDSRYMNKSITESLELGLKLRAVIEKYNGTFNILWHNNRLLDKDEVDIYMELTE